MKKVMVSKMELVLSRRQHDILLTENTELLRRIFDESSPKVRWSLYGPSFFLEKELLEEVKKALKYHRLRIY